MFPPSPTPPSSSTPCTCCTTSPSPEIQEVSETTDPPLLITTSEFSIKLKEIIILGLIFSLLLYSVITFLNKWSKSYRQINQIPFQYAEQTEELSPGQNDKFCLYASIPICSKCSSSIPKNLTIPLQFYHPCHGTMVTSTPAGQGAECPG